MDDLLHLVHSDGADGLKLQVGQPPIVVMDGKHQQVKKPVITWENAQHLLQSITDNRQRRDLWQRGYIEFLYNFRHRASFVVHARIRDENVSIDIH